jgi:hypothetical protein
VANIRSKIANFEIEQLEFRELFKQEGPFKYDCIDHYSRLDFVSIYNFIILKAIFI